MASKETFTVPIKGIPTKIYAASMTQALMAKAYIEKTMGGPPDLSPKAQRKRISEAVKAHKKRRGET